MIKLLLTCVQDPEVLKVLKSTWLYNLGKIKGDHRAARKDRGEVSPDEADEEIVVAAQPPVPSSSGGTPWVNPVGTFFSQSFRRSCISKLI